jgi:hypothetical protein
MNAEIGEFITAVRACVHQLWENAAYVRRELPNVGLPEPLQRDVEALCDTWLAAKHDALTDLDGIAEAMESGPGEPSSLTNRCRRVHSILGDVFEPTDRVIQQLRQAAQENARLGLAALLVTESAANILRSTPALPASLEEPDDADPNDDEIPPGCLAFHVEDEHAVKLLIRTLRQAQERPGIPPEDLAGLALMVAALERFPKSLPGVRAGVTLRHQVGEDSSWLEVRIEDGEFSLGEGTWSDGDASTETIFEVTESYRDGGFYPAYFFIEKFARWVANPEREIIVEESSDPGDTIPATEPDANLWGKLPGGYL